MTFDPRHYGHEGGNSLPLSERAYRPWYFGETPRGGRPERKRRPRKPVYREKWAPHRPTPAGVDPVEAEACADCGSQGGEPGDRWVRNGYRRYRGEPFGVDGVLCDGCRGERIAGPPVDPEEVARTAAAVLAERIGPPPGPDPPPFRAPPIPRTRSRRWSDLTDAEAARRIVDAFLGRADWDLFSLDSVPRRQSDDDNLRHAV